MLEDFGQRHVTIEGATQQSFNCRRLKQLVPTGRWSQLAVAHHLHTQRIEEFKLAHSDLRPTPEPVKIGATDRPRRSAR